MPDARPTAPHSAVRHVALIGAMGSGKSTTGARLAAAMAWPFVDNDAASRTATGATAGAEVVVRDGIDGLHAKGAGLDRGALQDPGAAVIAAAASTVVDPEVRRALERRAFVVWLHADPVALGGARRYAALGVTTVRRRGSGRGGCPAVSHERDRLFAQVADATVDTSRRRGRRRRGEGRGLNR